MFNPLEHPLCIQEPEYLSGHSAWVGHIPFALALISIHRPRLFVELGSHFGDSYCAFCQAIQQVVPGGRAFAVDTWAGDEHAGYYSSHVLDALRSHHDSKYSQFSTLLQKTFDEAVRDFDDGTIDLLHIDGLHTYDAVLNDFTLWSPKMSSRGIILFHDIRVTHGDFEVWRLWAELKERYPTIEFDHSHGLGVLFYGSEFGGRAEALSSWFAPENVPLLTDYFHRMGDKLQARNDGLNAYRYANEVNRAPEPQQTAWQLLESQVKVQAIPSLEVLERLKRVTEGHKPQTWSLEDLRGECNELRAQQVATEAARASALESTQAMTQKVEALLAENHALLHEIKQRVDRTEARVELMSKSKVLNLGAMLRSIGRRFVTPKH
ncbi:class I SAM-dependent methyltransferase [Cupriavidus basilensis]|uniref:class I SAM-dependent methyltransferase n=1 Tax=Cupriavidus basilensis TaxID=68895 RepID=UPI0023E8D4AC|nr:class I SAM-dependent methyltransferase [Cupriavidus basilensis]MDF3886547.1 class I SAM-dependent methyltransferase [Cupriavidus basilensis]